MSDIPGLCNLCGKPGTLYTCHLCGRHVCADCYNPTSSTCLRCAPPRRHKSPKNKFDHLLK